MLFDYLEKTQFTKTIDVVDIGNMALRAISESNLEYYIVTKTIMGKTSILKFGPVLPDMPMLLDNFNVTYQKIDYKEATIAKMVNQLINNYKTSIIDVIEITDFEALSSIPDIITCFNEGE